MVWIVWLMLWYFPNVAEYGDPEEIALEVLHAGDYGNPAETIQLAKTTCQALEGCERK